MKTLIEEGIKISKVQIALISKIQDIISEKVIDDIETVKIIFSMELLHLESSIENESISFIKNNIKEINEFNPNILLPLIEIEAKRIFNTFKYANKSIIENYKEVGTN